MLKIIEELSKKKELTKEETKKLENAKALFENIKTLKKEELQEVIYNLNAELQETAEMVNNNHNMNTQLNNENEDLVAELQEKDNRLKDIINTVADILTQTNLAISNGRKALRYDLEKDTKHTLK